MRAQTVHGLGPKIHTKALARLSAAQSQRYLDRRLETKGIAEIAKAAVRQQSNKSGGAWKGASLIESVFATDLIAALAVFTGVARQNDAQNGSMRCRQKDKKCITRASIFASIRRQARPGEVLCRLCIPYRCFNESALRAERLPQQANGLLSAGATRAGIDLPARRKWRCRLKFRQINHLHISAQVKHIIGGKPSSQAKARPEQQAVESSGVSAPVAARIAVIDMDSAGQRLDNFLLRELKGVPKTHVYRIIRSGEVRVNKGRASADTRLQAGDLVRVPPVRVSARIEEKAANPAPAREFPVLLDDEAVVAIDKPSGVAVHGGSGVSFGVIEQLRQARPQSRFLELVHRLDRETSGILLIAKKRSALTHLQAQFRERETGKTYLALVIGEWPANRKVIDTPLHKYLLPDGERRVRTTKVDDPEGMRSISIVKVRRHLPPRQNVGLPAFSLLEVTIKTGRTHQIRVHLASEGHAIAGDDKYGDFNLNRRLQPHGLRRMYLHAWRLQFAHPATDVRMELLAPLPPELANFAALS